jgi:hypothetical protein
VRQLSRQTRCCGRIGNFPDVLSTAFDRRFRSSAQKRMRSQCGAEEGMSVRQGGTSIGHRGRREHRWILVWQAGIVSRSEWCRL